MVAPTPQIFLVMNGNFHETDAGEFHQQSKNEAGSTVYELLANYQDYPDGGNGWLRLVRFVPGEGSSADRIEVTTYSPWRDAFRTGSTSSFHFELDFDERFLAPA